ncbi:F-box family protein [Trifolium pratense]|uniref:F-box family protein n=1 Tax=Trifolium pratense TaxID=57577 RepID=A0A2K3N325_TRIPR|nr:F-box family protein [Trifolium pratense]
MNSISQCQCLTSLRLSLKPKGIPMLFPKSLDLPSLTSLELENFAFRCGASDIAEPFLPFTKLNSLVLDRCNLVGTKNLRISSATLDNLGMHKNSRDFGKLELSAPSLRRFAFTCGRGFPEIGETSLSSVKQASILYSLHSSSAMDHGSVLFSWLKGLANVESLTLNSISLQILSLVPGLFEVKLPSMCKLKSLEVKLDSLGQGGPLLQSIKDAMLTKAAAKSSKEVDELRKAFEAGSKPPTIPDGIVNYLRQNSQFAKVNVRPNWPDIDFKQNKETKIEREVIEYNMQFATPSTFAESAAPTSIAESASYLCPAEKDDKSSNEDKVEKHQLNTDLSLPDNEQ